MQALPPMMNGTGPSFGNTDVSALSSPGKSSDLAQTLSLNQISTPTHIYHITAAEDSSEDRGEFNLGSEAAVTYTTQYYTTVEPPQSAVSSSPPSPEEEEEESGRLTPDSVSSKESSPSDTESEIGATSPLLSIPGVMQHAVQVQQLQNICVSSSGGVQNADRLSNGSNSSSGGAIGGATVKHWTYEDQFKQLYNLSPEPERKEFLDKLFDFMQRRGTPITRIPIMAKQPLDLYRLFTLVVERGGLVEVIKKKSWRNVARELNLPPSITSAAFTMRSQYSKYLYPYECDTVKLSEPHELQLAIESNKRDRRHSDTMPMGLGDPPAGISCTQGAMQIISSPTVPHAGSASPFSGGYIMTPGSIMATASGQLVQLPQVPGVPIVMPSHHHPRSDSSRTVSEDGEDDNQSPGDEKPSSAKKMALDANQIKVALSSDSRLPYVHTTAGNFIMTPGGTPIVAHPSMGPAPQFIQMAHHPVSHIPIVIPSPTVAAASSTPSPLETSVSAAAIRSIREAHAHGREIDAVSVSGRMAFAHAEAVQRRAIPVVNGPAVPIAAIPPHTTTAALTTTLSPQQHAGLLTMPPVSTHLPAGLVVKTPSSPGKRKGTETPSPDVKKPSASNDSPAPASTSLKVPFTNISIQPAGDSGGESNGSNDASLLVTLQLNSVVYQGVLFAKPNSVALSSNTTTTPSR